MAWRATLDVLATDLLQPATIFTICDIPGSQGYGISDKSLAKFSSSILQAVAIAVMTNRDLTNKCIKDACRNTTSSNTHDNIVSEFFNKISTRDTSDPFDIVEFSPRFAKSASGAVSSANQKIKGNVQSQLRCLYRRQ